MLEQALSSFHLLRPWWLLALLPVALILVLILRRERGDLQWSGVIAPNLLKHMTVTPQQRWRIRPAWLVASVLLLGVVALAGPTWRRELPPFVEDKAPLMIALDVSASMGRTDVAPSRLERAKQKIRDLLAARGGARTGLIAYAGSAHLVMPLTDDRGVLEPFLAALTPGLMPVQGKAPVAALELAAQTLAGEPFAGTVLLVADDLGTADAASLRRAAGRNGVLMLAIAPPQDGASRPIESVPVTIDATDIRALERRIDTRFQSAQADQAGTRWRDEGYWLLLPIALLSLLWFRRGMTVQWIVLLVLLHAVPADAQPADGSSRFAGIWLTPDQQGRIAFDRGDYARAAKLFTDPMWRGIAAYRAYDFLAAAEAFRKVETIEGKFALGNAEAQNHAYEKAIKAYQDVLAQQPDNAAAKTNLAIVRAALEAAEAKRRQQEKDNPAPPDLKADEMKTDEKQQGGKRIQVKPEELTTAGAAEAWMRQVQTTPADFLKLKFATQANSAAPRPPGSPP
ncbi:MAG: VWA domain-containing protein [Xanthobacteraceae bacterium]|nr:VWA domain-containing protein [Xanthobacteraceae bacterium]